LLALDEKLGNEYNQISGAQTISWEGVETTLPQLKPVYQNPDRAMRERAWRLGIERQLADREALNALWQKLLANRSSLAANAGEPSYIAFRWKQLYRYDYTPADCHEFHKAIEQVVVPAASRIYRRRQQRLGVQSLRPWDLDVDPFARPALKPFQSPTELRVVAARIFHQVDPVLGGYFDTMVDEALLDLENRKNKAPGGYCIDYLAQRRPFIFMNAVGIHDDVQTLLHEGGHAFHVFESASLPYHHQMAVQIEFAEVASMGMELLSSPYLDRDQGGYYTRADAARARIEHLEAALLFWPYMAVVDAFQHWVYEHPQLGTQPSECDAEWGRLWQRFMPGVDWSGLEVERVTGWQRKQHIFSDPLYYVEYGLAQLGAVQVWLNAAKNRPAAVAAYRRALALGGTVSLPELFQTAGVTFGFDAKLMGKAVKAMEKAIEAAEQVV
jgi:oligoendopeptidase F